MALGTALAAHAGGLMTNTNYHIAYGKYHVSASSLLFNIAYTL